MKLRNVTETCVVVVLAATFLVACSSTKLKREMARPVPVVAQDPIRPTQVETTPAEVQSLEPTPEEPPPAPPADRFTTVQQIQKDERSVFFDYNKYDVQPIYSDFLSNVGREVNTRSVPQIRVEGNTDSRGSRAYNMALGQQRAEAVRHALTANGIPAGSIATISYGKERPLATGNDEESYAINRRADILYSGEY